MLKEIFTGCIFLIAIHTYSQPAKVLTGKVNNRKSGEPVAFANIHIVESDDWAAADSSGVFYVRMPDFNLITIETSCLGYEPFKKEFQVSDITDPVVVITMAPTSYDMDEVTVLAKNKDDIVTSSVIGAAAIEHVQPVSFADILQLLPGNISENPNLSKAQKISMREVGENNNNALGTAILIDGAPVSNNANLQIFSTSKSDNNFITTVGSGTDLRQFSTDNIESIEFIKGIPSVVYGDLTSGAVIIKTKAGYTPWEVKLKTDVAIKQVSFGKGFNLKSGDNVNFSVDYLQSYDDIRSKYNGFDRLTLEGGYSKVFGLRREPLSFNAKLSYFSTIDEMKVDPDAMVKGENVKSENRGARLNIFGKWSLQRKLLSNLEYSFAISYSHQQSSQERYRTMGGIQVISTATTEGENYGLFLPSEQLTNYVVDGKPFNLFFQITGSKPFRLGSKLHNKILYGLDYRLDANWGIGQQYDVSNPPFVSVYNGRPRSYKDIPAVQNGSVYLEDKLSASIGKTSLDVQGGFRLNNFQVSGLFKSDLGFYVEPRLNAQYTFLSPKNSLYFDKVAVKFGVGKTYKSPPLVYLYPDKAYFDFIALNYYAENEALNTAVVNTKIFDTKNPDLEPSENLKLEAGVVFKVQNVNAVITVFREKLSNGFDFASNYVFTRYNRYLSDGVPVGTKPDISTLPIKEVEVPVAYQMPVNKQKTLRSGVEYSVELGKIKPIYTSFTVDGAWLRTKHVYSTIPEQYRPPTSDFDSNQFVGFYPAGEGKISERLNTNCRMVTQLPRLRMIVTTTVQMVWYDSYYFPEYTDTPLYLSFANGNRQEFTPEIANDPNYLQFVNNKAANYYLKEKMPVLPQVNFRLSKEIYDKVRLSFYVNNVVNYRPIYELKRSNSFVKRNPPIYFGAEVKFMI